MNYEDIPPIQGSKSAKTRKAMRFKVDKVYKGSVPDIVHVTGTNRLLSQKRPLASGIEFLIFTNRDFDVGDCNPTFRVMNKNDAKNLIFLEEYKARSEGRSEKEIQSIMLQTVNEMLELDDLSNLRASLNLIKSDITRKHNLPVSIAAYEDALSILYKEEKVEFEQHYRIAQATGEYRFVDHKYHQGNACNKIAKVNKKTPLFLQELGPEYWAFAGSQEMMTYGHLMFRTWDFRNAARSYCIAEKGVYYESGDKTNIKARIFGTISYMLAAIFFQ